MTDREFTSDDMEATKKRGEHVKELLITSLGKIEFGKPEWAIPYMYYDCTFPTVQDDPIVFNKITSMFDDHVRFKVNGTKGTIKIDKIYIQRQPPQITKSYLWLYVSIIMIALAIAIGYFYPFIIISLYKKYI